MKIGSPIRHKKSRIEIIPLIDIMFFLLASFMMVSLTLNKMQTIKVNLPTATQAKPDFKPDMINIAVDKAGDVYLEKSPVTLQDLYAVLTNKFHANTNVPVYRTAMRSQKILNSSRSCQSGRNESGGENSTRLNLWRRSTKAKVPTNKIIRLVTAHEMTRISQIVLSAESSPKINFRLSGVFLTL